MWKCTLWWDPFVQSMQRFRWKSTQELRLMTQKSDAKFEEKVTLGSKNDMRNLVNFNGSSSKMENLHFDVLGEFKKCVCSRLPSFDAPFHLNCHRLFSRPSLPPSPKVRSFWLQLTFFPSISLLVKFREKILIVSLSIFGRT